MLRRSPPTHASPLRIVTAIGRQGDPAALLRRQAALQAEALAVMRELDLRARLGRLGPFEHIGSSRSG